jgi:hypothetical protein
MSVSAAARCVAEEVFSDAWSHLGRWSRFRPTHCVQRSGAERRGAPKSGCSPRPSTRARSPQRYGAAARVRRTRTASLGASNREGSGASCPRLGSEVSRGEGESRTRGRTMVPNRPTVSRAPSMKRMETAVDPRCVEWCRGKLKLLGDGVDALWRPEVRGHPEHDRPTRGPVRELAPATRRAVLVVDAGFVSSRASACPIARGAARSRSPHPSGTRADRGDRRLAVERHLSRPSPRVARVGARPRAPSSRGYRIISRSFVADKNALRASRRPRPDARRTTTLRPRRSSPARTPTRPPPRSPEASARVCSRTSRKRGTARGACLSRQTCLRRARGVVCSP